MRCGHRGARRQPRNDGPRPGEHLLVRRCTCSPGSAPSSSPSTVRTRGRRPARPPPAATIESGDQLGPRLASGTGYPSLQLGGQLIVLPQARPVSAHLLQSPSATRPAGLLARRTVSHVGQRLSPPWPGAAPSPSATTARSCLCQIVRALPLELGRIHLHEPSRTYRPAPRTARPGPAPCATTRHTPARCCRPTPAANPPRTIDDLIRPRRRTSPQRHNPSSARGIGRGTCRSPASSRSPIGPSTPIRSIHTPRPCPHASGHQPAQVTQPVATPVQPGPPPRTPRSTTWHRRDGRDRRLRICGLNRPFGLLKCPFSDLKAPGHSLYTSPRR